MYLPAGAVLVASAFICNQIAFATIALQNAIVDAGGSGAAAEKHLIMDDEHRLFVFAQLALGVVFLLIGIVGSLRRRGPDRP